jgi:hypothetical protein
MGISMLGQTGTPAEGMTTVKFADGGGAAYDQAVFIVVTPSPRAAEILEWSVKQYKGSARQPSLGSANPSFAKISKQARQQNALTLWVNVAKAYPQLLKIIPPDEVPQQLKMATASSISNIDDLIATFAA